jgi:hypothetical protein
MELDAAVAGRREVVVQRGEQAHDVRRAAGDRVPGMACVAAARLQWIRVEERPTVHREPRKETVVEGPLEQVGEPALPGDQQQPPVPHDARYGGAGLAVGAIGWQLVRLADRLVVVARADPSREIRLRRDEVVPLREHRRQQRSVARLRVEVGHPRGEVEGAHGVSHDRARFPHGLDVLVIGKVEAPAGEEAKAAAAGELVRELEVAAIGGLAVQLDERDLDLRMPVGAAVRFGAEGVDEQIREAARDPEEAGRASASRSDPRLDQVTGTVELMSHLEVAPGLAAIELPVAVQVAVGLLRRSDELGRFAREPLELPVRLARGLPGERLEPFVDVGVAEDHAAPCARRPAGGDAQVLERPCPLELLRAPEKRHLAVDPLPLAEKSANDPHPGRVERPEPHPRRRCRRHTRGSALDRDHPCTSLPPA